MTKETLDQKINEINRSNDSQPEKTRRIEQVKAVYTNAQNQTAEAVSQKQQHAEANLKSNLKNAYMQNPVATPADFERDYPLLKSDYLRGEAMKKDEIARQSQRTALQETF